MVVENRNPLIMVECKMSDQPVAPALHYLKTRFPKCLAWQISLRGKKDFETPSGIRVAPALKFLRTLV